jgi:hypothetical protein
MKKGSLAQTTAIFSHPVALCAYVVFAAFGLLAKKWGAKPHQRANLLFYLAATLAIGALAGGLVISWKEVDNGVAASRVNGKSGETFTHQKTKGDAETEITNQITFGAQSPNINGVVGNVSVKYDAPPRLLCWTRSKTGTEVATTFRAWLLLQLFFFAQGQIMQTTTGYCSPVIAEIRGKVIVRITAPDAPAATRQPLRPNNPAFAPAPPVVRPGHVFRGCRQNSKKLLMPFTKPCKSSAMAPGRIHGSICRIWPRRWTTSPFCLQTWIGRAGLSIMTSRQSEYSAN